MDYPELKTHDLLEIAEQAGMAPITIYYFESAFLRFAELLAKKLEAQRAAPGVQGGKAPEGAIVNGRVLADRLEHDYKFECEAGSLAMCAEWQELRCCFEYLAASQPVEVPLTPARKNAMRVEYVAAQPADAARAYYSFIAGIEWAEREHGIKPTGTEGQS